MELFFLKKLVLAGKKYFVELDYLRRARQARKTKYERRRRRGAANITVKGPMVAIALLTIQALVARPPHCPLVTSQLNCALLAGWHNFRQSVTQIDWSIQIFLEP